ncbi:MAG TPA: BadF/BadG/BcrA/BcrD ATPase family protein, partial [Spirochaetota bacterium]|nr:BadF/BadG/BcrA/BcrD ATPase family protein [Spirochaetota bacterium]
MEKKISDKDFVNSIGICLGATTMSIVEISSKGGKIVIENVITKEHSGDPKGTLTHHLDNYDLEEKYVGVTGRKFREFIDMPSITEPEAVEFAYEFLNRDNSQNIDAIVSAGGETFMVYEIDKKGKISRVSSGNKCASGTGEFYMQQIKRMNVSVEEAIALSRTSTNPHQLSGRCSVFCKSDCTHALNKGESIADVAAGLARMIAKKIHELIVKLNSKKVMIVGGTTQNDAVIQFVKEMIGEDVQTPKEAPYFEALGASLWALKNKRHKTFEKGKYYKDKKSSFTFLRPLKDYVDMVDFKSMPYENPKDGDRCIVGLDVGSTTTKAVLFRIEDEKILKSIYLRTNGNPVEASRNCYKSLYEQLNGIKVNIVGVGVTGSGRYISGIHADTDGVINEIIAHARAAAHFDPEVDTIFEIGGQDAKYTDLVNSVASDYAMNEACSAGT